MKNKFFLTGLMFLFSLFLSAETYSGTYDDNLTWILDTESGILTISGTGEMKNYSYYHDPWYAYRDNIISAFISDGITNIGSYAFEGCSNLSSVMIGNSTKSIGSFSFRGCSRLTSFFVASDNPFLCSIDGVIFSKDNTSIIRYPVGRNDYTYAIPNNITSIENFAFSYCKNLTSVVIPNSVTSIGYRAFRDCSITSIICEAPTPPACHQFFINKANIPIYVPAESIELYRTDNILKNYNIFPIGSSSYGSYGDNLSWVFSNDGVLTITGTGAMENIFGSNYFCDEGDLLKYFRKSIKNIIISDGITTIGTGMCYMCNHLTSVYLPKTITNIENDAFETGICYTWICGGGFGLDDPDPDPFDAPNRKSNDDNGCKNSITSMTCEAVTPPTIVDNAFHGIVKSIPLYVPAESVEAYKAADGWKDFFNILPIEKQDECTIETTDGITVWDDQLPYTWEGISFTTAGTETKTLQASDGCDSTVTFTLRVRYRNIVLHENKDAQYYDLFACDYNGRTVTTATLNRQFTQGKWATLCLPFNVNRGMMMSLGLYNRVYAFTYAEQLDDETIQIFFIPAQSIEAGKGYIVNPNAKLAEKTSFVFPNVTVNTDADNGDITALTGYNDNSGRGNLYLVGTLRTGVLQGTTTGNTWLGLKDNQLYYPNTTSGTSIRAYRGFFRSETPVNATRIRIIAEGETVTEWQVVGTAPSDWSDKSDPFSPSYQSAPPAVKYIRNGILFIERNGTTYNAQGQRID